MKNCQDFFPTHYRAEVLTIFCSYFGRNDDFINTLAKTEIIYPKNVGAPVAMDFTQNE